MNKVRYENRVTICLNPALRIKGITAIFSFVLRWCNSN